jgi:hypothetical protein
MTHRRVQDDMNVVLEMVHGSHDKSVSLQFQVISSRTMIICVVIDFKLTKSMYTYIDEYFIKIVWLHFGTVYNMQ